MSTKDAQASDNSPWMLTVVDLSHHLQISVRSVWRLKSAGKLPTPVEIGGCVRWNAEAIRQWIDAGCLQR